MRAAHVYAVLVAIYATGAIALVLTGHIRGTWETELEMAAATAIGALVGTFLTFKVADNRIGPLVSTMGALLATMGLGNIIGPWVFEQDLNGLSAVNEILGNAAWMGFFVTTFVLLPLWFPTGRAITENWARVGRVAIVGALAALAWRIPAESFCGLYDEADADRCLSVVVSPWGVEGWPSLEWLFLVPMVMAAPALVSLWLRWRRGSFEERNQIKWLGLSMLWLLGAFFASMTIFGLSQQVIDVLLAAGLIGVWVGIGIAVTKYHLYDIGRVVSKTVTYALVVGVLGLVVAGVAAVVGAQFEDPLVVAATTLVIAALFNPVRKRVQRMVDRHFNRSRYDAQMVMDAFAGSLRDEVEPETVLAGWLEVVSETMQPEAVGVWVKK